jgi:hypothetical protein
MRNKKPLQGIIITFLIALITFSCNTDNSKIDRKALVKRNNPIIDSVDSLSSLSVGNGGFAYTVDITGLQTFPEKYKKGVSLGTQSHWGWHSFANDKNFRFEETLKEYDFGRGRGELYSVQFDEPGRQQEAANWFRINPHRLHLGIVGLELPETKPEEVKDARQVLDMWEGIIKSNFNINNVAYEVKTVCHPNIDMIAIQMKARGMKPAVKFRFPYPTGEHSDDACNWNANDKHSTTVVHTTENSAVLKRELDSTVYFVKIQWENKAELKEKTKNYFVLHPETNQLNFTCYFSPSYPEDKNPTTEQSIATAAEYWNNFWKSGAAVDFSQCTDPRAKELERRVVLSQYLTAIQCSASTPPQETGLTYNSWYGKFHLEMIWWHQAHFALWNRPQMLEKTLPWYHKVKPVAREIAQRQGFDGVRWMKITDPTGREAPSSVGSFLVWQQPHIIYFAELLYRANSQTDDKKNILNTYYPLIEETAKFMYSFASYDKEKDRYVLKGLIPAQETLKASETVNPPFELSYWHFAMETAQKWRERKGEKRVPEWDTLIQKLSPLAYNEEGLYLAAESAPKTYEDIRFTSDHMAVLGALGILPGNRLINETYMRNTLYWVWDNWNWDKTWGWDYPMTAMNAARLGEPEKAIGALLMDKRTNTYLTNGHNYQDDRLRIYLPGNGGLLTAIVMMCAGWDGCTTTNPGFPKDGGWNVKWENLQKLP